MGETLILVVDDEVSVRFAVEEILSDGGYQVITASNGIEALELLKVKKPRIILTDMIMPDMEGIEFIRKVRKSNKEIPFIVMSGNPLGKQFFSVADIMGATSTLLKPFSRGELLQAIAAAEAKLTPSDHP